MGNNRDLGSGLTDRGAIGIQGTNHIVQFGALQVTPRVCYSRDETEPPKTDTFVEVDEITLDRKIRYQHDQAYQQKILGWVETRLDLLKKLNINSSQSEIKKLEQRQDDLRSKLKLEPIVRELHLTPTDEPSTEDVPADDATEPTDEQAQPEPAPTDTVDTPPTEPLPVPVADPAPAPAPTEPLLR